MRVSAAMTSLVLLLCEYGRAWGRGWWGRAVALLYGVGMGSRCERGISGSYFAGDAALGGVRWTREHFAIQVFGDELNTRPKRKQWQERKLGEALPSNKVTISFRLKLVRSAPVVTATQFPYHLRAYSCPRILPQLRYMYTFSPSPSKPPPYPQ